MSIAQSIQWVVLPAGLSPDGAQARISVFIAPRLDVDDGETLGAFPDFSDWPARLSTARFVLDTTDREGLPAETPIALSVSGPSADSALWRRLFPPETPVTPFEFDDFRGRTKVSYPAKKIADSTRGAFAEAAADSPEELPTAGGMSQFAGFAAAADMPSRLQGIAAALDVADQQAIDEPDGQAQPELGPQDAFLAFHQQEQQLTSLAGPGASPPTAPPPPPRPEQPHIDFHQMLSALGDHPALLRRLGLVLDFTVPVEQLTPTRGELGLTLAPHIDSPLSAEVFANVTPVTIYALVPGEDFCAAASGSDPLGPPARGLMELPDSEYSIEQADIDGVNLKLLAASVTANTPDDVSPDGHTPERAAPPSVRTTGLALVRDGLAQNLQDDFRRAAEQENALTDADGPVILTAEDLVRGHRIDVFDESRQRWFSLHQRVVHYNPPDGDGGDGDGGGGVGGEPIATVTDEGFFQVSLMLPDGPAARIHVPEHVVSWDGWALSAPRPGKALVDERQAEEGVPGEPPGPRRIANRATTTLPLQIEAEARPGTLPRLRFGRSYRLRIRTVDLAGNGPTLEEAERLLDQDVLVLPPSGGEVFRRYEAVPSPALLPRGAFTHGDSAHRMVIRSTAELSPEEYADSFNASPLVVDGTHRPYRPADERHVVAPKASLECVERHGMLDTAIASPDPQVRRDFYDLAVRESGKLDDPGLDGVTFVDLPVSGGGPAQSYVLHTGERIELPYLPDPLSLGVVFHGLPGLPDGQPFEVPWAGTAWHTPRSLRLRIVEGAGPPRLDAAARVLTVELPKAAVRTIRVSSKAAANEKIMGMLHWCRDVLGDDGRFESVMGAARANKHWMLTPWHEITLVHGVQRPLVTPSLTLFDIIGRGIGDTGEHLAGSVELDVPSTERIDLFARWSEEIDDLAEPGPRSREMTAAVFRLPLALAVPFTDDVDFQNVASTLGDTALFFSTGAAAADAHDLGVFPATPEMQEFGDTKHRLVRYEPVATTPFGDCFPPEFAAEPERELLSLRGAPVDHVVLSSAKPAAPKVLDCLPTLAFETFGSLPDVVTRRRLGGGLRIYLARPWFTSGSGELLAVLVNEQGDEPEDGAHPFITLMGRDPIKSSVPVTIPTSEMFPTADLIRSGLVLPDRSAFFDGFTVTAVGYVPQFDPDSGRWFCDLDIDTGDAYFPFVRLALARFQPQSLEGEHLSPIVHSATLRTLPERVLTVEGTDPLTIKLSGPSYVSESTPALVSATLQVRDPDIRDDSVAWTFLDDTEVPLEADDAFSHRPTYFGAMPLPSPLPQGQLRFLVVEFAMQHSDLSVDETSGLGSRVVYSDVVPL